MPAVAPQSTPPPADRALWPVGAGRRPRPLAAVLMLVQVVVIVGFCVFYVVELALGAEADATQTAMSVVTFLVGAACLAAVARGLWRGSPWARTPAVLWNVLVLFICVSLAQSGQLLAAVALALVAVGGIAGVLLARAAASPGGPGPSR